MGVLRKTAWYPGTVSPVRIGMYERKYPEGFDKKDIRDFWNGKEWCYGRDGSPTIDVAINQHRPWRGLAQKP